MNLPNRLSLLRICLVPVCVGLMYLNHPIGRILALVVFLIAAFTDFLDGHIARSQNLVTDFGKFMDPVADKLLVLSMMVMLSAQGSLPAWMVVLVLARDLCVDGLRLVAGRQGRVIAAGKLGKIKTVMQMVTISVTLLNNWPFGHFPMQTIMIWLTVALTLWSGIDYFIKNKAVLFPDKEARP